MFEPYCALTIPMNGQHHPLVGEAMVFFTLATIGDDPWSAVHLDVPPNPSLGLLQAACAAAAHCLEQREDELDADIDVIVVPEDASAQPSNGMREPELYSPEASAYFDPDWLMALHRFEEFAEALARRLYYRRK